MDIIVYPGKRIAYPMGIAICTGTGMYYPNKRDTLIMAVTGYLKTITCYLLTVNSSPKYITVYDMEKIYYLFCRKRYPMLVMIYPMIVTIYHVEAMIYPMVVTIYPVVMLGYFLVIGFYPLERLKNKDIGL